MARPAVTFTFPVEVRLAGINPMRLANRILSILALAEGISQQQIASTLQVSKETIRLWLCAFLLHGGGGLETKKSPGRPSKLTQTQRKQLAAIIEKGPAEEGTHLQYFQTFKDLINKVEEVLFVFKNTAKEVLTLFGLYNDLLKTI